MFNYFVDPYGIKTNEIDSISAYNRDENAIALKITKDKKYETVVIGGSTTAFFNPHLLLKNPGNVFYIATVEIPVKTIKNYLEYFLSVHPEVKRIIIPIEYNVFFINLDDDLPVINNYSLTIKERSKFFLSLDTTILSIQKLKKKYGKGKKPEHYFNIFYEKLYSHIQEEIIDNFKYYDEIFNLVEKYDVEPIVIVPPYHTLFYVSMQEKNIYKYVKKINKYTSMPMEQSYLYHDICHPVTKNTNLWGYLLHHSDGYNNVFYKVLTNENIDDISLEEEKKLKQYINANKDRIDNIIQNQHNNSYIVIDEDKMADFEKHLKEEAFSKE